MKPQPSGETPAPLRPSDWRVGVWRSFLRAHATVTRQLEQELVGRGVPIGWYDVLLQLAEAPGRRLRMADLADRVLLSRSGLTRLVDRLQAEGYVRREPSRDDARGTYTVLTREGFEALRRVVPIHLGGVQQHWLAKFSDDELRVLSELLGRLAAPDTTVPPEAATASEPPSSE
ncbi:MAG TPA: MarR family transcriptional regulator [Jatrophihabitans sp.]|jgi:DNA-binding MarR family transcriptional regulator|uniref:MarR family winged helix-turn-helix transcriptional regulator n=1 Tax=Jatrophihabitans sp. TaxID=1932789 RepID=UPI002E03788A|nr:MarR family transcriptional regulator [Jatrophihabitans sp.]